MIIRLTKANFSSNNIGQYTTEPGTLTFNVNPSSATVTLTCAAMSPSTKTGTGSITWANIPAGSTVSYEVSLSGYNTQKGSISIYGNTSKTVTLSEVGSVTPPPTEPDEPGTGGGTGGGTYPTVDIAVGTINAPDGQNGSSAQGRWRSITYTDITSISSNISLTGCKYIISCYDSSKAYLGQKSATGATLIKGSGQWLESGTVVNVSELKNNGASYIRFVLQAGTGISIKFDGVECFGTLIGGSGSGSGSGSTNYKDFEVNYPFDYGSIVKETGAELAISSSRRVRTDFISIETLSPNFTVKETRFLVCCYGDSNAYLGQYNGTEIISGDTITAPQWIDTSVVINTSNLSSLGVKSIRLVGETGKDLPFVYINDVKMTKSE